MTQKSLMIQNVHSHSSTFLITLSTSHIGLDSLNSKALNSNKASLSLNIWIANQNFLLWPESTCYATKSSPQKFSTLKTRELRLIYKQMVWSYGSPSLLSVIIHEKLQLYLPNLKYKTQWPYHIWIYFGLSLMFRSTVFYQPMLRPISFQE